MGKGKTPEIKVGLTKIDSPQITYKLPSPQLEGILTVEQVLSHRRSHRSYLKDAISAEDLSQILWAAYGITKPLTGYPQTRGGLSAAPSAGALYPLELYALIGNVKNIEPGVYKYKWLQLTINQFCKILISLIIRRISLSLVPS